MKTNTEGMEENNCKKSETEVIIRTKNVVRFKAGADLSGKLNRATVEINEDSHEEYEQIEVRIELFREVCKKSKCQENN